MRHRAEDTPPGEHWAIYPSCDIELGTYFRSRPELEGRYYVDVDVTAIKTIISDLSPEDPTGDPELRFEAAKLENIDGNSSGDGRSITLGLYERKKRLVSYIFPFIKSELPKCVVGLNLEDALSKLAASSEEDDENIIVATSSTAQETTVHELRHAVDFNERHFRKTRRRWYIRNLFQLAYARALDDMTITLARTSYDIGTKGNNQYYQELIDNSPHEQRAQSAQAISSSYPGVISIRPIAGVKI